MTRRLRLRRPIDAARFWPWDWCEEHAAVVDARGCPGPAFDLALAARSVTIRAAFAFGDWPPAPVAK